MTCEFSYISKARPFLSSAFPFASVAIDTYLRKNSRSRYNLRRINKTNTDNRMVTLKLL